MPHSTIMSIGLSLYSLTPTNERTKIIMLTMKLNADSVGSPKFSFDMSIKAAEPMSPTMTGLSVLNILFMSGDLLCLSRYLLMLTISMNGSHMMLSEANMAPRMAAHVG